MKLTPEPKARIRKPKFKGLCADAEALGVSRKHLYFVLIGTRQSARLMRRYQALKIAQAERLQSQKRKK